MCKSYIQIRSDDTRNAFPSSCDNVSVSSVLLFCCCVYCEIVTKCWRVRKRCEVFSGKAGGTEVSDVF